MNIRLSSLRTPRAAWYKRWHNALKHRLQLWLNPCYGIICEPAYSNTSHLDGPYSIMMEADVTCKKCGKKGIYNCGQTQTDE